MTASAAPSPPPPVAPRRRWLRWLLISSTACLLLLGSLLGLAWWWSGQSDSLARTLERVAQWLPDTQTLEARGVQGTLRQGGHIDWLRWSSPALQVEVQGADIGWSLRPLLSRTVHFGQVQIQRLRIHSTPTPDDDTPLQPLESLVLPVRIDLPLHVEQLLWEGPPAIAISALNAHYRYTGGQHALDIRSLEYAQGQYTATAHLQAAAPMQLEVSLQGLLHTSLPQSPERSIAIQTTASVQGTLATQAARLQLQAQALVPHEGQSATPPGTPRPDAPASAQVLAVIAPWQPPWLEQAQVQLQHVNLAWFLPGGPRTDLQGSLQAGPDAKGWKLQTDIHNLLPGPWDQQSLPLRRIQAAIQLDDQQRWALEHARLDLGSQGDAHIQAQGTWNAAHRVLEGHAELVAINPAALYSTLEPTPLSGSFQAQRNATEQVEFALSIRSAPARSGNTAALGTARATGTWQAPWLRVNELQLDGLQATLRSQSLTVNTDTLQLQGQIQAQLPGTRIQADLNASPANGQGHLQAHIQALQPLTQWLARWPSLRIAMAGVHLDGHASAELRWQGGWGRLQQRLQNPAAALAPSGLRLQAQVQIPQLRYQAADGRSTRISAFNLALSGSPEALQADVQTQASTGTHQFTLQTQATAGLLTGAAHHPTDWQARITTWKAQWRSSSDSDTWTAQLAAPSTISHTLRGRPVQTRQLSISGGQLQVTAPASVNETAAKIIWDPITLHSPRSGSWMVQTKGSLQDWPVMWADRLNPLQPPLAAMGINGDLVLQGQWDIDTTGREMRAHAVLERARGDLRLMAEDGSADTPTTIRSTGASERSATTNQVQSRAFANSRGVRARIQTLQLQLDATGNDLHTQLLWKTEAAGQLDARIHTQLRTTADGITWPANAPLQGRIQAALPNIGVWAFFAPPGWRATGSFASDLQLSGTRQAPQWQGSIQAEQLSLQSLLDGVDLRNGRLRAQLQGTRLEITELQLHGGAGSDTRIPGPSGNLTAAPQSGGTLTGAGVIEYDPQVPEHSSGLRMDLHAVADHLQVLVRADRQLSVSGKLQAALHQGQFKLDGDLSVDRAAIMLVDDAAPTLDSDVRITSAASRKAAQDKAAKEARRAASVQTRKPPMLDVRINLGEDFALQGYGITTRLGGALTVTHGPRITGEIRTINGRYRAWGQVLDVEQGTIRFSGPYANPAIDIVAIRPNIDVRAGVKVTGSASNPRVTLFSNPEMSDAEKLSWIMMGRGASGGGAEAVLLQQAALAMLSGGGSSGNFASQLGFDEIGFKGPTQGGEQGAALTVSKRLSKDLYVTYEHSLSGAMGTLYVFYDLSRRLTLRAQTGEQSAVDLIYTQLKD